MIRRLINILLIVGAVAFLSACHSQRRVVRGSDGMGAYIEHGKKDKSTKDKNKGQSTDKAKDSNSAKSNAGKSDKPISKSEPYPQEVYDNMRRHAVERDFQFDIISELVNEASKWIGTLYVTAGHSLDGTDCSGFTMEIFNKVFGTNFPRVAADQDKICVTIEREDLLPGDLVFFATNRNRPGHVSHVGLYIGDDEVIHSTSRRGVIISNLNEKYYTNCYLRGGRPDVVTQAYLGRTGNATPIVRPTETTVVVPTPEPEKEPEPFVKKPTSSSPEQQPTSPDEDDDIYIMQNFFE